MNLKNTLQEESKSQEKIHSYGSICKRKFFLKRYPRQCIRHHCVCSCFTRMVNKQMGRVVMGYGVYVDSV